MANTKVHDAISKLLGTKLAKYGTQGHNLNVLTCTQIYQDIFNSLVEIAEGVNLKLTNEAMNYLAQQYYDGVLINNTQELDPNIFTQRAKLESIQTEELVTLAMMLNGTDFVRPVIAEIKQRS